MRILNQEANMGLDRIILYLTVTEAAELQASLESMLTKKTGHHEHIPSEDYKKELTICIYDKQNLESFDERSKQLILKDE